ncbi:MAG TPA: DUF1549 domain-containing protein, partial [Candidatus Cybelea sp.]|nr:DUF1549 domain-containing protein [Candidatus Cybelea sp.]
MNARTVERANNRTCSSDGDSGERGRPARSVWRLAKHISASTPIDEDQVPRQPSAGELINSVRREAGRETSPAATGTVALPRPAWLCGFAVVLCLVALTNAATAADDPAGLEFFENKIRPILVDNCYSCHSQQSAKIKGGLLLDTREGLLKGGDDGPAIKPGDLEESLLIKAVRYDGEKLRMPPKDKKLPPEKIAALEAWVKMGAPDPRVSQPGVPPIATIREKARSHWAFQPIQEPTLPDVKNKQFARTPMDNFVLARLEAARLSPSPAADKRTLIRRATFDLIGLPPTPEEAAAFESDPSPEAFAKVVDRLLASPRYGERWGRHWLDVARYADTKGYVFEEDRH